MSHDRHFVETGLTVEDDDVVVPEVTFYDPSIFQTEFVLIFNVTQIDASSIGADNMFGTRMAQRSIGYEFSQNGYIERSDAFRHRQIGSDAAWDSHVFDSQIWIRRDDRPGGKVHPLSHQISTNSPLLSLETLLDRLERPSASTLGHLWHSSHLVIHRRSHIVLQALLELRENDIRFTVRHGLLERNIRFDDIHVLIRKIVLALTRPHRHTRTYVQGRHRQHRHHHPLRTGPGDVQTQGLHILVGHARKYFVGFGGGQHGLAIRGPGSAVPVYVGIIGLNVQTALGISWLSSSTMVALLPTPEEMVKILQSTLARPTAHALHGLDVFVSLGAITLDLRAVIAHAPQRLKDDVNESLVVHRGTQLDVSEETGVGLILQASHAGIVHAAVYGLSGQSCLEPGDARRNASTVHRDGLRHAVSNQFGGVGNAELEFGDAFQPQVAVSEVCAAHAKTSGT
mmetsp:Transcript_8389/g.18377  ORF Transcript_8389/g.18377 Transcript_8389/m.18377 type:complete len:455 (+) Transcript_8389:3757-5121(+)